MLRSPRQQNLSRDWVIGKISFNVPFDIDVAKVKEIVKRVRAEVMQEPTHDTRNACEKGTVNGGLGVGLAF